MNTASFRQTRIVNGWNWQEEALYLSADEEADYVIAQYQQRGCGRPSDQRHVVARKAGDTIIKT